MEKEIYKLTRGTVYNDITSNEKMSQINMDNVELEEDFLHYLESIDRSKGTITQYKANLHVFWCWNLEFNGNVPFVKLKKREIAKFQNHALNEWGWSSRRLRTVKATLASLGNFVENILDDEYPDYKSIIGKVQSPADNPVRNKTVFNKDELQRLLDHLVEKKQYMKACALALAINGGRRKAELPRFKVGYFRPEFLICNGALYKTPEKVRTKGRGQNGKHLDLYTLAVPFQPYLDLWLEERRSLGINSEWLFPRKKNGMWYNDPMPISTLDSWTSSFSVFLGKPFYWHSLRHYFTTLLISYDIPSAVIQDIIGWDSADMVNRYDDTDKDDRIQKYFGAEGIKRGTPMSFYDI